MKNLMVFSHRNMASQAEVKKPCVLVPNSPWSFFINEVITKYHTTELALYNQGQNGKDFPEVLSVGQP
jgi:hypothetical protein